MAHDIHYHPRMKKLGISEETVNQQANSKSCSSGTCVKGLRCFHLPVLPPAPHFSLLGLVTSLSSALPNTRLLAWTLQHLGILMWFRLPCHRFMKWTLLWPPCRNSSAAGLALAALHNPEDDSTAPLLVYPSWLSSHLHIKNTTLDWNC